MSFFSFFVLVAQVGKNIVVCFLLGNSPASKLPRRKHKTFRTRRKF